MLEVVMLLLRFKVNLFTLQKFLFVNLQMNSFELFPSLIDYPYIMFLKDQGNVRLTMTRILIYLIYASKGHILHFLLVQCKLEYVIQQLLLQILFHMLGKEIKNIFTFNQLCFQINVLCMFLWLTILCYLNLRLNRFRRIVMN